MTPEEREKVNAFFSTKEARDVVQIIKSEYDRPMRPAVNSESELWFNEGKRDLIAELLRYSMFERKRK